MEITPAITTNFALVFTVLPISATPSLRLLGFLVRHIVNWVLFSTDFHRFLN